VWVCTDSTTGEGAWVVLPKLYVTKTLGQNFPDGATTLITWDTTNTLINGTFDGTYWTPGKVGWVNVTISMGFVSANAGMGGVHLYKNSTQVIGPRFCHAAGDTYYDLQASFGVYNDHVTNRYSAAMRPQVGTAITNQISVPSLCYFSGAISP